MPSANGERQIFPRQTIRIEVSTWVCLKRKFLVEVFHVFSELFVCKAEVINGFTGVEYGGVISFSYLTSNTCQGSFSEFFSEIHCQLPRLNNMPFSCLRLKCLNIHLPLIQEPVRQSMNLLKRENHPFRHKQRCQ